MRFRTVLLYPWALIFLLIPTVFAQKQVVATVNPNTAALSSTADIYDPRTGIIAPVAGKINVARKQHVAVRLGNGQTCSPEDTTTIFSRLQNCLIRRRDLSLQQAI